VNPYLDEHGSTIYHGDCRGVLPALAENRFDTCITDPPYHLTANKKGGTGAASLNPNSPAGRSRIGTGFMGKAWDGGDVAFRPETWAAVLRVCKPGAMLLAFGGTRTFHRLTCAIEDGGWEIRDCMSWLYGSGFPKSLNISKSVDESWEGWGTALKPAWEPIIVAMKPLDGTFAENALRHGVAGLNIDGARISPTGRAGDYDHEREPGTVQAYHGFEGRSFATSQRSVTPPNPSGRWPANVLLDEAAAAQLDEQSGILESGEPAGIKNGGGNRNCYGEFGGGIPVTGFGDAGGASRFFYPAKASRSERGHGNTHPTVKPTDLLKYLCILTATPTGGEIIDPFGGSMTTLVAAREACRPAVAIELEEEHCRIGIERLRQGVLWGATG